MSAANAAARKRRTAPDPAPPTGSGMNRPSQFGSQPPPQQAAGLTLPQVIAVIDSRLIKLEGFMKEANQNGTTNSVRNRDLTITDNDVMLQEFDKRFEILAEEIGNLKDMLLKLQSFTMDVNKTLMDERVRVFSDLGNNDQNAFSDTGFNNNLSLDYDGLTLDLRNLAESELLG